MRDANGDTEVVIVFEDTKQKVKAPKTMMVNKNDKRIDSLINLLGEENVKYVER